MPLDRSAETAIRVGLASQSVPTELIERTVDAVSDVVDHYVAGRIRPSEFSAGDFGEAFARILQFLATGRYTPLGRSLPRFDRIVDDLETSSLDDSLRIHVPRLLQCLYDIRNRRGVGHLPGPVSANRADSELILGAIKWILCEVVRLFHASSHVEAQRVIDRLVVRHIPAVEDFEGTLRVVSQTQISTPDTILILLAAAGGEAPRSALAEWARVLASQFATALGRLDERNLIHRLGGDRIRLTSLGSARADELQQRLAA